MTTAELVAAVRDDPEMANASTARDDSRVTDLLKEMCTDMWLSRNDRNLWEIGPRSYLELSSYFQVRFCFLTNHFLVYLICCLRICLSTLQ
jgi:hypothetical protein